MNNKKVIVAFNLDSYEALKDKLPKEVVKLIDSKLKESDSIPMSLGYYVNSLAKKVGWDFNKMDKYLCDLASISTSAVFSTILREVAIELDKKYEDHIEHSEHIFVVSVTNGHIAEVDKKHIRNFRNFAAFRTKEDAQVACKVTRGILRHMFKNGKQKD